LMDWYWHRYTKVFVGIPTQVRLRPPEISHRLAGD
jgi:hypothetical protein